MSSSSRKTRPEPPAYRKTWLEFERGAFSAGQEVEDGCGVRYRFLRIVGTGSFSVVVEAREIIDGNPSSETVAIKKILCLPKYRGNFREIELMEELKGCPNVIQMRNSFAGEVPPGLKSILSDQDAETLSGAVTQHIVMPLVPTTLGDFIRHFRRAEQTVPLVLAKIISFQIFGALSQLHKRSIVHRDLKPHNILLDPLDNALFLGDFGSAKRLGEEERHASYICARYYRAPELLMNAVQYSSAIDMWAAGCILAELFSLHPLFKGASTLEQLVQIIVSLLGTPSPDEVKAMKANFKTHSLPSIEPTPLPQLLPSAPPEVLDLCQRLLCYDPNKRMNAEAALAHPFFDELRDLDQLSLPYSKVPSDRLKSLIESHLPRT